MVNRILSVFALAFGLLVCVGASLAADDKHSHEGKFVSAQGEKFVMEDKGEEHSHTLATDAKVLDADGKECKLADFKKGQKIRVTTKEGDKKIATKVEAMKD